MLVGWIAAVTMLALAAGPAAGATRPAAAGRVPAAARRLRVTVVDRSGRTTWTRAFADRTRVHRTAVLLDALRPVAAGAVSCTLDTGARFHLTFVARRGGRALATAVLDPGGCGPVTMRVGPRRLAPLQRSRALLAWLHHLGARAPA